jgi:nitrite reductase/ring-hydroxylating ferredoxin subunit
MNTVTTEITWFKAAPVEAFPENGGACVKYGDQQIAVFNFRARNEWYASQNLCPHKMQMALSRGITGDSSTKRTSPWSPAKTSTAKPTASKSTR